MIIHMLNVGYVLEYWTKMDIGTCVMVFCLCIVYVDCILHTLLHAKIHRCVHTSDMSN